MKLYTEVYYVSFYAEAACWCVSLLVDVFRLSRKDSICRSSTLNLLE